MVKYVILTIVLAIVYSLVLGVGGFCAGFFGPMYFAPDAPQGPLLGLFILGPGGFVLGVILGILHGTYLLKKNTK